MCPEPGRRPAGGRLTALGSRAYGSPVSDRRVLFHDGYEIERSLGRGGMGEVWLAFDRELRRLVALKLIGAELLSQVDRCRFAREAQTLCQLRVHLAP